MLLLLLLLHLGPHGFHRWNTQGWLLTLQLGPHIILTYMQYIYQMSASCRYKRETVTMLQNLGGCVHVVLVDSKVRTTNLDEAGPGELHF